ncbi:hypothetical protein [Micromonospora profundi]|uniref:hypothetical protein n=1 Tax=Micromonospora profundi TaxID=1420889 RepID=UPI003653CB5A
MRASISTTINRQAWDRQARLALPHDRRAAVGAAGLRCLSIEAIDAPSGDVTCCLLVHAQKAVGASDA